MAGASANQIAKLEQFAATERELAQIEAERTRLLGEVNAEADRLARPVLAEQAKLRAAIAVWWTKDGAALCPSGRKSIELGGCMIGSHSPRAFLAIDGDLALVVAALEKRKWAGPLLRTKVEIDRAAVLKSIDGVYKRDLAKLGFRKVEPDEQFVLKRAEQGGTLVAIGAGAGA